MKNQTSRSKRKLVNASEQPSKKVLQTNVPEQASALFMKKRASNQTTTTPEPLKKKVKQISKGENVASSQANMTISNRLQQTMIREPNVKKQLRKSQEIMEQSTTKKPQNAYYDDGVVFTGR